MKSFLPRHHGRKMLKFKGESEIRNYTGKMRFKKTRGEISKSERLWGRVWE